MTLHLIHSLHSSPFPSPSLPLLWIHMCSSFLKTAFRPSHPFHLGCIHPYSITLTSITLHILPWSLGCLVILPQAVASMQQGWALAVPPASNGHGFCVASTILSDLRVTTIHWAILVAEMVKNLCAMQGTQVQSLRHADPLDKRMAPTLVFLCGEFHGQRSLAGCSPCGHKETDTTEWLTLSQFTQHSSPKYKIL